MNDDILNAVNLFNAKLKKLKPITLITNRRIKFIEFVIGTNQ